MPNVNKIKNAGHVLWRFAPHIFFVAPPNIYKYFDGRWGGRKKNKILDGRYESGPVNFIFLQSASTAVSLSVVLDIVKWTLRIKKLNNERNEEIVVLLIKVKVDMSELTNS